MIHQALDDSDKTRKYGISEYIMQALIMTLLRKLCRNIGLVSWIRDAILSRLVTIIKRLVYHAVYCMSLSCLLSFLYNPYIPFLIYEIFHLLVIPDSWVNSVTLLLISISFAFMAITLMV